jgi:hypothetical protein
MAKAMEYEKTAISTKLNGKEARLNELNRIGTPSILWYVVKRHKVGLLITSNIVLAILYLFPFAPGLLVSIIKGA